MIVAVQLICSQQAQLNEERALIANCMRGEVVKSDIILDTEELEMLRRESNWARVHH